MEDPDDVQALNFIQKEIGYNTKVFLATKSNILDCLENYRGNINAELDEVIAVQKTLPPKTKTLAKMILRKIHQLPKLLICYWNMP